MPRTPWWIVALVRLYPRDYRDRHAAELARAMHACFERERIAGAHGAVTVLRIGTDAVGSSWLVRRDERRARRTQHVAPGTKQPAAGTKDPAPSTGDSLMQSLLYALRRALPM